VGTVVGIVGEEILFLFDKILMLDFKMLHNLKYERYVEGSADYEHLHPKELSCHEILQKLEAAFIYFHLICKLNRQNV